MSNCRTCHAEIVWTITETGARMPVDAAPVENGNLILDRTSSPATSRVDRGDGDPGERYVSHFATCPYAQQHRSSR